MLVIIWTIYSLLIRNVYNVQLHQNKFHIIWIIAFICAIIPVATDFQQNVGGWCYINESEDGVLMQLFCDYFWCLITWIFSLLLYIRIISNLFAMDEDLPIITQTRYYPLVFAIIWLFGVFRRTISAVGISPPLWLISLQIFFTNLYGLCNAIVWGLTIYHHIQTLKRNDSSEKLSEQIRNGPDDDQDGKLVDPAQMKYDMRNNELIDVSIDLDETHDDDK